MTTKVSSRRRSCSSVAALGDVEALEHVVAEGHRVLDLLEAERFVGQPGHGQGPGNGSEPDHQVVVGDHDRWPFGRRSGHVSALGVDRRHRGGHDLAAAQDATQRDDDVPGFDASCRGFGEERLVGHRRSWVDDRDRGLPPAECPLQAERGVQADVPTSEDDDARWALLGRTSEPGDPSQTTSRPQHRHHGDQGDREDRERHVSSFGGAGERITTGRRRPARRW